MIFIIVLAIACCAFRLTEVIRRDRFGLGPTLYIEIAALAIGLIYLIIDNGPRSAGISFLFLTVVIVTAASHTIILFGKGSAAANPPC
jgi:hypothetical protein